MIPEEDRGPAWLSDYGAIEANIAAMEDFAASLYKEVQDGYEPHLQVVTTSMMTALPPAANFPELNDFMTDHHTAQQATFSNTFNFRDGTGQFATAAATISAQYAGSDAFSHARVKDVDRALQQAATPPELG